MNDLASALTETLTMSCPCARGDFDLCPQCPYQTCPVHSPTSGHVFVVAGNEAQYRGWLTVNHVPPGKAIYVSQQHQLRGHPHSFYVTVGDYAQRPDWTYLSSLIRYMRLVKIPCNAGCVGRG